jgi:hypothetical protein
MPTFRSGKLEIIALALVLAAPAAAGKARAAPVLVDRAVYVADSTLDRILMLIDRDGSGRVEPDAQGEVTIFYDDASPGPDLSLPSALLAGPGQELYLLDGGTLDAVIVLADRDGDGTANGEGEWRIFFDGTSPAPNLSTPKAMAFGPDGALFIADDGSRAQRILRVRDEDGDGSANGPQEWKVVYDQTALSPAEGPLADLDALAFLPDGRLLVTESTLGRIEVLSDLNGDGDFLDAGEAALFYDPRGAHPFGSLTGLAAGPGGKVYAADSVTGLVLLLEDRNGDGAALDPGEWSVFLDPVLPPNPEDVRDLWVEADGTLVLLDNHVDSVLAAGDLDQDGSAAGDGEALAWFADPATLLSTPDALAVGPAPPPPSDEVKITAVTPASGPPAGGTRVRIQGRFPGFETAVVTLDGAPAAMISAAMDSIECVTPPGTEGPADLRVSTRAGEAVLHGAFVYRSDLFVRGDGNADGTTDVSDAVSILTYLFLGGPRPVCQDAVDVDDDGALSITDPIYLLSFLFLSGPPVPPPHSAPGPDPTPDTLACPAP